MEQNLILGEKKPRGASSKAQWSLDDMYRFFPHLKERRYIPAGVLSGGEQQMLTLCRTLMGNPDMIIIDEPTEGLGPRIVHLVGEYLVELRNRGISVPLGRRMRTRTSRIYGSIGAICATVMRRTVPRSAVSWIPSAVSRVRTE
nr:ATP-binding cassette domain-containing protein [Bradyrhizobium japonicum]